MILYTRSLEFAKLVNAHRYRLARLAMKMIILKFTVLYLDQQLYVTLSCTKAEVKRGHENDGQILMPATVRHANV